MAERQERKVKITDYPPEKRIGRNGNFVRMEKGERLPGAGRQPGTPNKITRTVKDWLLAATEKSGSDGKGKDGAIGYLVWLSRAEPVAYAALLARVMPMQIQATLSGSIEHGGEVKLTAQQLEAKLRERGLPIPSLIDHDPHEFDVVRKGSLNTPIGDQDED